MQQLLYGSGKPLVISRCYSLCTFAELVGKAFYRPDDQFLQPKSLELLQQGWGRVPKAQAGEIIYH